MFVVHFSLVEGILGTRVRNYRGATSLVVCFKYWYRAMILECRANFVRVLKRLKKRVKLMVTKLILWETTIPVKTVGTIPPITMLIFHALRNQRSVHRSLARFNVVWGEGGGGGKGARKGQWKKNTRCSYNDGSMYHKFSTFRPKFDKCPENFWPGLYVLGDGRKDNRKNSPRQYIFEPNYPLSNYNHGQKCWDKSPKLTLSN